MCPANLSAAGGVDEFKLLGPCDVRMKWSLVEHVPGFERPELDVQFSCIVPFPQLLIPEQFTEMGLAEPAGRCVNVSRRSHV